MWRTSLGINIGERRGYENIGRVTILCSHITLISPCAAVVQTYKLT